MAKEDNKLFTAPRWNDDPKAIVGEKIPSTPEERVAAKKRFHEILVGKGVIKSDDKHLTD